VTGDTLKRERRDNGIIGKTKMGKWVLFGLVRFVLFE
jgi:hypothetical protein